MSALPLHRSQDLIPIPPGLLTPRDVYDFAKVRADALRAELARGAK